MESCCSGCRARCCVAPWAVRSRAMLKHAGSRRGSSGEFRFFIRTGRSFQTLRYDAATAVCAATADDADAEAPAASTRTVVETEEGFSFDVAFWEGAIRFGGAEIICGESSRIESQCVVLVVFCFRPPPSWDCRGKE